jgi:hypothetical protein
MAMPPQLDQRARLTNGIVDVEITTACGPRVLRFGLTGERNLFALTPHLVTQTPLGPWYPIGGHRLWVAPERMPGSYAPDAAAVALSDDAPLRLSASAPPDAAGMQKTMRLALEPDAARVVVTHEVVNHTCWPIRVAPWAITIVDPAGTAVLPQPVFRPHSEDFLPARPLVQWAYTDLTDARWHIGSRLLSLTPHVARPAPQKVGAANHAGWCAVVYQDCVFVKEAAYLAGQEYPDLGCSTELFTAGDYLEVETLAPLQWLEPGAMATHVETWSILRGIGGDLRDAALETAIDAALAAR